LQVFPIRCGDHQRKGMKVEKTRVVIKPADDAL
jgi:hypothetical protein